MKEILLCSEECNFLNRAFNIESVNSRLFGAGAAYKLREKLYDIGYEFKTIDTGNVSNAELIIFLNFPSPQFSAYKRSSLFLQECLSAGMKHKLVLWMSEPPSVIPAHGNKAIEAYFSKILTWNDDLVDGKLYFKQPKDIYPLEMDPEIIPFNERKLCTIIGANKYSNHPLDLYGERRVAIREFERICPYEFDLYGIGWGMPNSQIQQYYKCLVPQYPSFKGVATNISAIIKNYKFYLCFENMIGAPGYSGWITERIFHCFMSGSIPIYLGANNIQDYVPKNLFIDRRRFNSYNELYSYIMLIQEREYMERIQNIKEYLESEFFKDWFSLDKWVERFIRNLFAV
jgi:hypothetical protein